MYGNEPFVKHPKEAPRLKSMRSAGFRLSATDVFSTETFLFTGTQPLHNKYLPLTEYDSVQYIV